MDAVDAVDAGWVLQLVGPLFRLLGLRGLPLGCVSQWLFRQRVTCKAHEAEQAFQVVAEGDHDTLPGGQGCAQGGGRARSVGRRQGCWAGRAGRSDQRFQARAGLAGMQRASGTWQWQEASAQQWKRSQSGS